MLSTSTETAETTSDLLQVRSTLYIPQIPEPKQAAFLWLNDREVYFGGAGGGGKSSALLMGALQYVDIPGFAAVIFRRTYSDLALPGALMSRAQDWLSGTDAKWNEQKKTWRFPSNATLTFANCEQDKKIRRYQGIEAQYIAWDEIGTFPTDWPYRFMFSRLRRPALPCLSCGWQQMRHDLDGWKHEVEVQVDGTLKHAPPCDQPEVDEEIVEKFRDPVSGMTLFDVPLRVRAAGNPGGPGHAWNYSRFVNDKTRVCRFIPSYLDDNPHLDRVEYEKSLEMLDPVEKARILRGDWTVRQTGQVFNKAFVQVVEDGFDPVDTNIVRVRYWDMAATEVKEGRDPDWTVGVKMAMDHRTGRFCIEHIERFRAEPHEVEQRVAQCAANDGRYVDIVIEQEPGSSGKAIISHYQRNVVPGYYCEGDYPTGAKELRIRLLAPVVRTKRLDIVAGPYVEAFLDEMDAWPGVDHDDQLDAATGAHQHLTGGGRARLIA